MKKIFLTIICFAFILCLSGCFNKKAISIDEILTISSTYGYNAIDTTEEVKIKYPKTVQSISLTNNENIEIEFIVFENSNACFNKYANAQKNVASFKQDGYLFATTSSTNSETYELNTKEYYYYVARVDETFINIKGSYDKKDELKSFIEEIGY